MLASVRRPHEGQGIGLAEMRACATVLCDSARRHPGMTEMALTTSSTGAEKSILPAGDGAGQSCADCRGLLARQSESREACRRKHARGRKEMREPAALVTPGFAQAGNESRPERPCCVHADGPSDDFPDRTFKWIPRAGNPQPRPPAHEHSQQRIGTELTAI